ncbi:unnamed protein product [Effrenium voratum]|nr:unnamed protein product [Effrenium voratum]
MDDELTHEGLAPWELAVRESSIHGLRAAMMAVLRESALQSLAEILLHHQFLRSKEALRQWHTAAKRRGLHQQHAQSAVEKAEVASRLKDKHELEAARLRSQWNQERKALLKKEMTEEEIRKLREMDGFHRSRVAKLHDFHEKTQLDTQVALDEAQTKCKRDMKVLALSALEQIAQTRRPAATLEADSPSVCFLQWAFTPHPEVWCVPSPPAANLQHAIQLSEQRRQLAAALHGLRLQTQSLAAAAAASAALSPAASVPGDKIQNQHVLAARLLRRSLLRALRRQQGPFLQRLLLFRRPNPRAARGSRASVAFKSRASLARANADSFSGSPGKAFVLGEDLEAVRQPMPAPPAPAPARKAKAKVAQAKPDETQAAEAAAVKIQRAERQRAERQRAERALRALPEAESHLPSLPPVPKEVAAATKIQAQVRLRAQRRDAAALAAKAKAETSSPALQRRSALKLVRSEPAQEAVKIQAAVRGRQTRRRLAKAQRQRRQPFMPPAPAPAAPARSRASTRSRASRSSSGLFGYEEGEEEEQLEDDQELEVDEVPRPTLLGPRETE